MTSIDSVVEAPRPSANRRTLCAYSPRWLSGPTPGYQGLVASVAPSERDDDRSGD